MFRRVWRRRRLLVSSYLLIGLVLATLIGACAAPGTTPATPTLSSEARTAVAYFRASPTTRPATPTRVPATPTAARATPTRVGGFTATIQEPCRPAQFQSMIPEKRTTLEVVGQAYRCLLLYYVGQSTMNHRTLLQGALRAIIAIGAERFTPEERAPLVLTGSREEDWATFAARFNQLVQKTNGSPDSSALARIAIGGMADSLNDNHVAYLEPKYWRRTVISELGLASFPSAGFEVAYDEPTGKFFLYTVYPGSPAARAGFKRGDMIEKVGGAPIGTGRNNRPLADLVAGLPGTGDTVEVIRPATNQAITALIRVDNVEFPLVEVAVLPGKIGYIRLRHFAFNADEDFAEGLRHLRAAGVKGIIFDVRQNPGGSVNALLSILSNFTHEAPLGIAIDASGRRMSLPVDPDVPLLGLPWVVLCDGDSASAADVVAAVAKDRGGHLVGTKSAGALGGAIFLELEDGSALEVTVVRVLGPNGEEINEIGVAPDHPIPLTPLDLSLGVDPPLQHAIDELRGRP